MRAIDDFDKSFDMKPLRLVEFNCLPEPIVIPKMRIRDLTREVDDVERTFRDAYDCGMRDSHSYHSQLQKTMSDLSKDLAECDRINRSVLAENHKKSITESDIVADHPTSEAHQQLINQIGDDIQELQKSIHES